MVPLGLDASHELNFYTVEERDAMRLVEALRALERPRMSDVPGPRDVFVDLNISADLGPRDTLLALSHLELDDRLYPLAHE
jgi:hypothetical protein